MSQLNPAEQALARAPPAQARHAPSPGALRRAGLGLGSTALRDVGSSAISSAAYDTGFVARLAPMLGNDPLVIRAVGCLRATQSVEGWWGSPVENLHDRVLSTLSAAAGLLAAGERPDSPRLVAAASFLASAAARLTSEPQLVGSDLLIPPLVERCAALGLPIDARAFPYRGVGRLAASLYGRVLYSGHPVGHLIELLGDRADEGRILAKLVVSPSSSVMCAPSSTAFALEKAGRPHERLVAYLRASQNADGGVRHFGPFELMEACYSLYALRRTPLLHTPAGRSAAALLRSAWRPNGIAFSREFPAVDLDDSVLAALCLFAAGDRVSSDFLDRYATAEYFLCYLDDRRPTAAPNLHAIEALKVIGHPRAPELTEIALACVRSKVHPGGSFTDHYSVSPYYPTWHAIEALLAVDEAMAERSARFLASTQREDGAWGPLPRSPPTAEDTAYALLGLSAYAGAHPGEFDDAIAAGARFLLAHRGDASPPTWVAKVLYAPPTMAACAVAGALFAAADALAGGISLSPTSVSLGPRAPVGAHVHGASAEAAREATGGKPTYATR